MNKHAIRYAMLGRVRFDVHPGTFWPSQVRFGQGAFGRGYVLTRYPCFHRERSFGETPLGSSLRPRILLLQYWLNTRILSLDWRSRQWRPSWKKSCFAIWDRIARVIFHNSLSCVYINWWTEGQKWFFHLANETLCLIVYFFCSEPLFRFVYNRPLTPRVRRSWPVNWLKKSSNW